MSMLKWAFVVVVTVSFLAVSSFSVSAKGAPGSGPNPFSDCGIGAALFSNIPNAQAAAVTSNLIWDLGSTALTSATASPQTCSGSNLQAAKFILDTYDNLIEETAKGQGDHLTTVLNILGCDAGMHQDAIHAVRSDMARNIVSHTHSVRQNSAERASEYYDSVTFAVSSYCPA